MKKSKLNFLILSLPMASVLFPYSASHAGLRINNSSVVQNQIQSVNTTRQFITDTQTSDTRTVTNNNGETVTISASEMDACNAIYPGGAFDWVQPTMGLKRGESPMCSSLIEMRAYNNGGTSYTVLATGYLGAGDSIKCNIDEFQDITAAGLEFTYPADAAPTVEDVEQVMAQENKSNAGFKILAAAVVGGLGGNLLGKGEAGNDSAMGLGKDKLKATAIGAASGAALMTASTQVNDYKAGSIILSTGMNAAAGAVAGNVMATGDEVLQIDKCTIKDSNGNVDTTKTTCVYGTVNTSGNTQVVVSEGTTPPNDPNIAYFYGYTVPQDGNIEKWTYTLRKCSKVKTPPATDTWHNCETVNLTDLEFDASLGLTNCNGKLYTSKGCKEAIQALVKTSQYVYDEKKILIKVNDLTHVDAQLFIKIKTAQTAGSRTGAMIPVDVKDNIFGYKKTDWNEGKITTYGNDVYNLRGEIMTGISKNDFIPATKSASDGDVVDFNNQARTKSTMIGAGGGAALGALSGASGANTAIQERWTTAVREYEDSLGNISCSTGTRYLSKYNDTIVIPVMTISD